MQRRSTPPPAVVDEGVTGAGSDGHLPSHAELQRLLWLLAAATFLIFFQAFMIAPLIPRLATVFATSPDVVALAVPAYLIPYGAMTLVWGPLSDGVGRRAVILGSLVAFIVLTAATASAGGATSFLVWRLVTAVGCQRRGADLAGAAR